MSEFTWCRTCGKEYKVCSTCADVKSYTPWRTICCTAEHYKIWLIVEQYRKNVIDKKTAKEQLMTVLHSKNSTLNVIPAVKGLIEEILQEDQSESDEVLVEEPKEEVRTNTQEAAKVNKNKGRTK